VCPLWPADIPPALCRKARPSAATYTTSRDTIEAVGAWIESRRLGERDYLFPSRVHTKPHLSTRQYSRVVERWVSSIGLDPKRYGTHSMRRTKAAHIYKKTGNLRAVQLLLGHKKLESTVQYLGIEVDDALAISEQVEL
ncbi:Phage integrase family protein, partial [Sinorhizobium meliloti]